MNTADQAVSVVTKEWLQCRIECLHQDWDSRPFIFTNAAGATKLLQQFFCSTTQHL